MFALHPHKSCQSCTPSASLASGLKPIVSLKPLVRATRSQRQLSSAANPRASSRPATRLRVFAAATEAQQPQGSIRPLDPGNFLRVHYLRKDRNYKGWGLHVWGDTRVNTQWQVPLSPSGVTSQGIYWDLPLQGNASSAGFLVHKGEQKAASGNVNLADASGGEVWLVGTEQHAFTRVPALSDMPAGSINKQSAHWVTPDTILWRQPPSDALGSRTFALHFHPLGYMHITGEGVQGAARKFVLTPSTEKVPGELVRRFPHLYGCTPLVVPQEARDMIPELLSGQLMVSMADAEGDALDSTGVQVQGVLDVTMAYDGPLGDYYDEKAGSHTIAVWAPTAQHVELLHWPAGPRGGGSGPGQVHAMTKGPQGTWLLRRPAEWLWSYYKFRVKVWCPWTNRLEVVEVTDPYSRGLAADGERTQIVDLNHHDTMPAGWLLPDGRPTPPPAAQPHLNSWCDISLYELHVRDFSITDPTVPERLRGKFLAFCPERIKQEGGGDTNNPGGVSHGLAHLGRLRAAGMTHLHLLPLYDFATVPERQEDQLKVTADLTSFPPDSDRQQAEVLRVASRDGFNWGYDPVHWGVPDGSYATDPDGVARLREFREMVQALRGAGWRVVADVVYNHIYASGPQSKYSVLDKLVPGYYLRRHEDGGICDSACCNNTATEHVMCERLVVEDITHWARDFRIEGFRFDIMGHLMMSTMEKIRASLNTLSLEQHGVDGPAIYIYGEAWDFGEVVGGQRGRNAGQMNLAGSGLGAFNDRLRDGALGGGPFSPPDFQGLVTGLALAPNRNTQQGPPVAQLQELLVLSDWVRYSLAGLLRSYVLPACDGRQVSGGAALCHGVPLAYGGLPHEHIAFIGCHDNQTLFDQVIQKAHPEEPAAERGRMAALALALIALSQGVPFFHAGDDLLRSKSLDRDSYDSGDWFNRIDWTGSTNTFGSGLPVSSKNSHNWHYKRPLLADAQRIRPSSEIMQLTHSVFRALLRVRYSSPLFRMSDPKHICTQLTFLNTGPNQIPGVIAMHLTSAPEPSSTAGTYDPHHSALLVVFNCSPKPVSLEWPSGLQGPLELHPELTQESCGDARLAECTADNAGRRVQVAARTTTVFVQRRQH